MYNRWIHTNDLEWYNKFHCWVSNPTWIIVDCSWSLNWIIYLIRNIYQCIGLVSDTSGKSRMIYHAFLLRVQLKSSIIVWHYFKRLLISYKWMSINNNVMSINVMSVMSINNKCKEALDGYNLNLVNFFWRDC